MGRASNEWTHEEGSGKANNVKVCAGGINGE